MKNLSSVCIAFCIALLPSVALAAPELTYRHEHHLFFIDPDVHPEWQAPREVWTYNGQQIRVPASLRVDGDELPEVPEGVVRSTDLSWNTDAIAQTLRERIAPTLDRAPSAVTIAQTATGVVFEGIGMLGRTLDVHRAAVLTVAALEEGVTDIVLPVHEVQPDITVQDAELREKGILEIVAVGESNYQGSPNARKHNIRVGLNRFNGHLIEQGSTFSFNDVLGPVNKSTGYLPELVILGEKTLPDYGGGLCQVSTTAYRGVWETGFPIAQRKNHSFSVRYYAPQGTDATIYPPHTDIKFVNDGPSALLIQTHTDENDRAYFVYYGTRDDRKAEIVGPYIWDRQSPPPDRVEYTTDIPPGTTRKVGERVPGLKAAWFRIVHRDGEEVVEPVYSTYEARPLYTQIGVAATPDSTEVSELNW